MYDAIFDLDAEINRQRGLLVLSKKNHFDNKNSNLTGCDLLTPKKLEQEFLAVFEDWFQKTNFKDIEFDVKVGSSRVANFFKEVPDSIMTPWLRFLILSQTHIERENLLKVEG